MKICGCAIEAQYQLRLLEEQKHKPLYIKNRIGKYTRRRDKRGRETNTGTDTKRTENVEY